MDDELQCSKCTEAFVNMNMMYLILDKQTVISDKAKMTSVNG